MLTEEFVENKTIEYLKSKGYQIDLPLVSTRHGVDIATHFNEKTKKRYLIECKGTPKGKYPQSQTYSYFVQAIGQLILRSKSESDKYGLAFPDLPYFRKLIEKLPKSSIEILQLDVFIVKEDGTVEFRSSKDLIEKKVAFEQEIKKEVELIMPKIEENEETRKMWDIIKDYAKNNKDNFIKPLGRGQDFMIHDVGEDYIKLKFSKSVLPLKKWRFISSYLFLKQNIGNFVELGQSKGLPRRGTLERMMKELEGKPKGLMTVQWVVCMLFNALKKYKFRLKPRQAIKMVSS